MTDNKKSISSQIDWLSITFPPTTNNNAIIPKSLSDDKPIRVKSPIPVYKDALQYGGDNGVKILYNAPERLGKHVLMTGKTLRLLRNRDENAINEIWDSILDNKGKVGRVDIAVDLINTVVNPQSVLERLEAGLGVTDLENTFQLGENGGVETLYVGNWKSTSRKLRVYDKGIEQKVSDYAWTRIEYEKRRKAHNTCKAIFEKKYSLVGIVRGVLDFPTWGEWREIMNKEPEKIIRGGNQDNSDYLTRLEWILRSAIPAIAKNIVIDMVRDNHTIDTSPTADAVSTHLTAEINRLLSKT